MSMIRGKQIADNSLDAKKLQSSNLPSTVTLGSEKTVDQITNSNEFTTKAYVDKATATNKFLLVQPDGTEVYGATLQGLIDSAQTGAVIKMFANAESNGTTATVHKNAVKIDTNGFDIPYIIDSGTSGKCAIMGDGRVGRIVFTQPTTEVVVSAHITFWAVTTDATSGAFDSKFSCKFAQVDKPVVITRAGWFTFAGAVTAYINAGVYQIDRYYTGTFDGAIAIHLDTDFTGRVIAKGELFAPTYWGVVHAWGSAAGTVVIEDAQIVNERPAGAAPNGHNSGIQWGSTSTTAFTLRGNVSINASKWSFKNDSSSVGKTVNVEGNVHWNTPNFNTVTLNHVTPNSLIKQTADSALAATGGIGLVYNTSTKQIDLVDHSVLNQSKSPLASVGVDSFNTGITISGKPKGVLYVSVNGMNEVVGNGVKSEVFYFSGDNGVTAKTFANIVSGDRLYFNPSIAKYDLETLDVLNFVTISE